MAKSPSSTRQVYNNNQQSVTLHVLRQELAAFTEETLHKELETVCERIERSIVENMAPRGELRHMPSLRSSLRTESGEPWAPLVEHNTSHRGSVMRDSCENSKIDRLMHRVSPMVQQMRTQKQLEKDQRDHARQGVAENLPHSNVNSVHATHTSYTVLEEMAPVAASGSRTLSFKFGANGEGTLVPGAQVHEDSAQEFASTASFAVEPHFSEYGQHEALRTLPTRAARAQMEVSSVVNPDVNPSPRKQAACIDADMVDDSDGVLPTSVISRPSRKSLSMSNQHFSWAAMAVSPEFEYFLCIVILLNAVFVGVQIDYVARTWSSQPPLVFLISEGFFCLFFTFEIGLRVYGHGCSAWFTDEGVWHWNIFDLAVVAAQILDLLLRTASHYGVRAPGIDPSTTAPEISLLRFARFLRCIRVVRFARVLRFLGGLRMLIVSIEESLHSLGWVMFLLSLQTFVFGAFVTQAVNDHKLQTGRGPDGVQNHLLHHYWGTLDASMLSLYQVLSGGIHWSDILDPLRGSLSPWWSLAFVVYIAFAVVAVMNVVTGVFVDAALVAGAEEKKELLLQQMSQLFLDLDEDGSGTVSAAEFEMHMNNPQMVSFLKGIDLIPQDVQILFSILDVDKSGEIDPEELVSGCLRLHGNAKAFDLACFMEEYNQDSKQLHLAIQSVYETMVTQFRALEARISEVPQAQVAAVASSASFAQ